MPSDSQPSSADIGPLAADIVLPAADIGPESTDMPESADEPAGLSLASLRAATADRFNADVRSTQEQLTTLAETLRQLAAARLVRLDSTLCPHNTTFHHHEHVYRWFDAEANQEQETLPSMQCASGRCDNNRDAEDALWLRMTTAWNRFKDASEHHTTLSERRTECWRRLVEIDQQLALIADDDSAAGAGPDQELLDPDGFEIPAVEEPQPPRATDFRTDEERREFKTRLIESIEEGVFEAELVHPEGGMDDFKSVLPDEYRRDADVWATIIQRYPDQLQHLPREYLDDPNFALRLLENRGVAAERTLQSIPESLRNSLSFILNLIEKNWRAARDVCPDKLRNHPEVAIKALRYFDQDRSDTLKWLSAEIRDNPVIMSTAVLADPACIRQVSARLRDDHDFAQDVLTPSLALCEQATRREQSRTETGTAATYDWRVAAREQSRYRIERRRDFWPAVETIFSALQSRPRDDEKVMLLGILHDGRALQYASDRLRGDRAFVLTAMSAIRDQLHPQSAAEECRNFCGFLSDSLKDQPDIAIFAIECCGGLDAMGCWSSRLQLDPDFVLQALSVSLYRGRLLAGVSESLRNDRRIMTEALSVDGSSLQHAGPDLRNDKRFVMKAIAASVLPENFEKALERTRCFFGDYGPPGESNDEHWFAANHLIINVSDLPESLRGDADVVLACLETGASARGAAPQLLNDPTFVKRAVDAFARKAVHDPVHAKVGERLLGLVPDRIRDHEEVLLAAIRRSGVLARHASTRLKNDPHFAARAMRMSENPRATLESLDRAMRDNDAVMQTAAEINAEMAVSLASDRVRSNRKFAFAALQASRDPDSLRTKLSDALSDATDPLESRSSQSGRESAMTTADWWLVGSVVSGGVLFGYGVYSVPNLATQIPSPTNLLQLGVGLVFAAFFVIALRQVLVTRREQQITRPASSSVRRTPAPPSRRDQPDDDTIHYTRGGLARDLSPDESRITRE